MQQMQQGPLAGYMPYTRQTEGVLRSLAALKPQTLAVMHGSSHSGHSDRLLTDLAGVIKENFDRAEPSAAPDGGPAAAVDHSNALGGPPQLS
jgi:hypothetical protein